MIGETVLSTKFYGIITSSAAEFTVLVEVVEGKLEV